MKLVRFGPAGKEKPGCLDAAGRLRDLSAIVPDIGPAQLSNAALKKLAKLKIEKLPLVAGEPRMGCPIAGVGKFIAIGLNYRDHAIEAGMAIPKEPIVFMKAISCIQGADDAVMLPKGSKKSDWEVELGVVIGSKAQYVSQKDALQHVAGYCVVNDLSERAFQLERGGQWIKGKSCPNFCPTGPYLVTKDEIQDVLNLNMHLSVNGVTKQNGNTKTMVFNPNHIVYYLSQFMKLEAGDLISSGTPFGVGLGFKPPQYLSAGDVVELSIDGLGSQKQLYI